MRKFDLGGDTTNDGNHAIGRGLRRANPLRALGRKAFLTWWISRSHSPRAPNIPLDIALASFDVFDTLITRRWITPEDLHLHAGQRLARAGLLSVSCERWQAIRVQAEAACRAIPGVEEVSLDDIYRRLANQCNWDEGQRQQARDIEIECEVNAIRPIAPAAARLDDLSAAGVDTALVTDTYLPASTIHRLLDRCAIDANASNIFISVERGATKRTGRLFDQVAVETSSARHRIRHCGDNWEADVLAAFRKGIQATLFTGGNPTRHETTLGSATQHPRIMRSALAGAARCVRLSRSRLDPHQQAIWDASANVSGPLLFGFVLWVLQQARERGLDRLYFIARDGQVLLQIAEAITRRLGWDIECRYLYGSRQAWHLPALDRVDAEALDWLLDGKTSRSLRDIFARVSIDLAEIAPELQARGFGPDTWDAAITEATQRSIRELLIQPEIERRIVARAGEIRDPALGYFAQEGLLDGNPVAIVDIGWRGRLQRSLTRILEQSGRKVPEVTGFYLGLESKPADLPANRLQSYLDIGANSPTASWRLNPVLLEIFCAADHGSVHRYEQGADGIFLPVLQRTDNEAALAWGLHIQQQAIAALAGEISDAIATLDHPVCQWIDLVRGASGAVLLDFKKNPTRAEATAFGSFGHAEHQTHDTLLELAPILRPLEAVRLVGSLRSRGYRGFWIEASFKRSARPLMTRVFDTRQQAIELVRTLRDRILRPSRALRADPA